MCLEFLINFSKKISRNFKVSLLLNIQKLLLKEVNFFGSEEHPSEGKIKRTRPANTFSGGGRISQSHAPRLGENTLSILGELGYSEAEIKEMVETGSANQGN